MSDLLLLLRHAAAGPSPDGTDLSRPLTPLGREQARRVGGALARRLKVPVTTWCGPARRCRETADLATQALRLGTPVAVRDELALEGSAEDLARLALGAPLPVLLVGHQPDLSSLAARLLAGQAADVPGLTPATCLALAKAPAAGAPWRLEFVVRADEPGPAAGLESP